jgi:hypothetical protein
MIRNDWSIPRYEDSLGFRKEGRKPAAKHLDHCICHRVRIKYVQKMYQTERSVDQFLELPNHLTKAPGNPAAPEAKVFVGNRICSVEQ